MPAAATRPEAPAHTEPPTADASPWQRLRTRFAMPGCDYNPAIQHWARWYTESPAGFSTSLSQAMPFLLVVLDQIEQRKLPGEFAFLPYLESNYTPLASSGDRAAGIWQLMPDTAREAGLRINHDYDGRLDVYASTTAALELLQRYRDEFGDWRLADMAYNAGEYRVRQLVGTGLKPRTETELSRLRVNRGTHEHLSKMLALACIVSDPERFNVELPEPQDGDHLVAVDFPAAIDLRLAARLADVDATRLQRLNPGYLRPQMPSDGPWHLLIPVASKGALERTLAELPQSSWHDWHEVVLKHSEAIGVLASANAIDSATLATINHVDGAALLAPGTRLLLPGRGTDGADTRDGPRAVAATGRSTASPSVIVRSGDTLWSIARREHVPLDDLLRWNGLGRKATLRLGQRLRLRAPSEIGGGQATAAAAAVN
jgi:membrane-bound lytic murein transglycosylase D